MARPRFPERAAIVRLVCRSLSFALSLYTIIVFIVLSTKYGSTYGGSFAALITAILIDTSEIAGLADSSRTIPRLGIGRTAIMDLIVIGIGAWSLTEFAPSSINQVAKESETKMEGRELHVAAWYCTVVAG
ncbi:hypothetical protein ONS95_001521 [Cadophora gregata]|uniref:uncharacterized protein n=1 Tax=Cadophora gregata TaxID=51156 RepID=UPI0026DD9118|nr:uncharacterized protein ONS95_001521 [Cadophora gregata]KAK0111145.1 hypothetical protein ONS95_001521 [Cadophora gregata]KAK0112388.1 hypothetical protein ONS96_001632 [Cadophora gregata f. sp. sojae]